MRRVVCSYINPDLDWVACSIALELLGDTDWVARVLGAIDGETALVLQTLGLAVPPGITDWTSVQEICLVDTHNPTQLPPDLPSTRVTRIIDHHQDGDTSRYPNADIQNEAVGAAATLLTERYAQDRGRLSPEMAILLQAAIASNTLGFRAPATCSRDRVAYEKLATIQAIDTALLDRMKEVRGEGLNRDIGAVLSADVKLFDTHYGKVVISQIEAPGALRLLANTDLSDTLQRLVAGNKGTLGIVNLVDTGSGESAVLATDANVGMILSAKLRAPVGPDGVIHVNRLLQRKTDIVPYILNR